VPTRRTEHDGLDLLTGQSRTVRGVALTAADMNGQERERDKAELWPEGTEALTLREETVLGHLASGFCDKEIASIMGISEGTVGQHLDHIYRKLGVDNRVAAAMRWVKRRVPPDAPDSAAGRGGGGRRPHKSKS